MKVENVDEKALTLADTLRGIVTINTVEEYSKCNELWQSGKAMMKSIDAAYDDIIDATNVAHKKAVAKKKLFYLPVKEGTTYVKSIMIAYDDEQERVRLEKEIELRKAALKIEENAKLQAAIEAEDAGQTEAASHILEEPIIPPPVIVPKTTPKLQGGLTYRTIWNAEVFDFKALVKAVADEKVSINALLPNQSFLKSQATDYKKTLNFPGVRAFSRRV